MSSEKFATPLNLNFLPSKTLQYYLIGIHVLGVICTVFIEIPLWLKCLLMILIVGSFVKTVVYDARLKSQTSIVRMIWGDHLWRSFSNNGVERTLSLLPGSFVLPFFIVLKLKCDRSGKKYFIPVYQDAVDRDVFRQLKIRLHYYSYAED